MLHFAISSHQFLKNCYHCQPLKNGQLTRRVSCKVTTTKRTLHHSRCAIGGMGQWCDPSGSKQMKNVPKQAQNNGKRPKRQKRSNMFPVATALCQPREVLKGPQVSLGSLCRPPWRTLGCPGGEFPKPIAVRKK